MGADLGHMKADDEVVIGIKDLDVIQQMQENHGGWNSAMMECMTGPCKLIQGIGADAVIRGPSGNIYRINTELLTKYNKTTSIKSGSTVKIISDESLFRDFQIGHGGMPEGIKDIIGRDVEIIQTFDDGDYKVKYKDKAYTINKDCIVTDKKIITSSKSIAVGAKLKMISDEAKIKSFQENHGGWNDLMRMFLGQEVEVMKVFDDGDCYVSKFGMEWLINPQCLEAEEKETVKGGKLKKGDVVKISEDVNLSKKLQSMHGGWVSAMKMFAGKVGQVDAILPTGDVKVKVSGMSFVYNRQLLTKVEGGKASSKSFSPGDKVKIIKDKDKVKRLQKGHGEWVDSMKLLLGEKGKVKFLFPDGDLRVKIMGNQVTLNPECVEKCDSDSDSEPDILKMVEHMHKMFGADSNDSESDSEPDQLRALRGLLGVRADRTDGGSRGGALEKKAFHKALKNGDIAQVRNLVDVFGSNGQIKDTYPLIVSSEEGHMDIVNLLLEKNAEIDKVDDEGNTALHMAAKKNRYDISKLLLEKGANINSQNNKKSTPLMFAAETGAQKILLMFLSREDSNLELEDSDGDTALHLAVQKSQLQSVETLISHGANMKSLNQKQFTPFHLAALRGNEKILEVFLKKAGTSLVDLQKEDKFAAIHLTAINNHVECMKMLIQYKADINIRNTQLQTPLHIAVSQKYLKCVETLVDNGAEINLKDESGDTPLHDGIRTCNMDKMRGMSGLLGLGGLLGLAQGITKGTDSPEDIVLYLVKKGAKLDIKNSAGKTPLSSCQDSTLKARIENAAAGRERKISGGETKYVTIEKVNEERRAVPEGAPGPNVQKDRDDEIEELRKVIKEMEEQKLCNICFDRRINVTFDCGHTSCDVCANNIFECHMCRKDIQQRIRIYN